MARQSSEGALLAVLSAAEAMRLTDRELLAQFGEGDQTAFAAIVKRHSGLVLGVCRRMLPTVQDAEDACQATFLVLARKAKKISWQSSIANWLYTTARRVASTASRAAVQRMKRESRLVQSGPVSPLDQMTMREGLAVLDEELEKLPAIYREPLISCYLQGLTRDEAAIRLGIPSATLKSQLERGRKKLGDALTKRGVDIGAGLIAIAVTFSSEASSPRLVESILATVGGSPSASVAAIAKAAAVNVVSLKAKLLALATVAAAVTGIGLASLQIAAEPQSPAGERASAPPPDNQPKPAVDRFGDPLPERAVARLGTVRFRTGGLVCACALSPDGKTLAAGGADNTISLFDAATGKSLRKLSGHPHFVASLAFSPDGGTLASGGQIGIVLWDPATGKQLRLINPNPGHSIETWSVAFTPDGKGLISAGENGQIHLWDPATGKEIRQFKDKEINVRCAALSPDGRTLASATADKEIQLWEMATGKLLHRLTGQKKPIRALTFSPDGKLLASGTDDSSISSIWLWDVATGKIHSRLPEEPNQLGNTCVRSLAFSPDGETIAAGCGDYTLCLWGVANGEKLHEMKGVRSITHRGFHDGGIQCVVFSRDGKSLVFTRDNQLASLDVSTGKEISPLPAPRGATHRVFFSPDGKRLLTTNEEPVKQIVEWDSESGQLIRQVPGKGTAGWQVSFSPDRKIMASAWRAAAVDLWDTTTGKEVRRIPLPLKNTQVASNVVFSPNGKLLAVEEAEGNAVWLYDAATGEQICTVEEIGSAKRPSVPLAFSSDSRLLAATDGVAIHLAEIPSGRQLLRIAMPKDRHTVGAVAIAPDSRTLAVPSIGFPAEQTITLWESASGKERLALTGPQSQVADVAFSPDGRLLAAGAWDNIVYVWDTATGKQVARLEGHQGWVMSLTFSPDGRRLASGSQDTTALIWNVSGLAKELPRRQALTRKEFDELWSTLAGADAAKAYQAILTLESVPDQTVPLLAKHMPLRSTDDKRITQVLSILDNDNFAERERATKELREMGWTAEPALHKALANKPSEEMHQRVDALLDNIRKQPLPPEQLRMLRGMEVLERIGSPEACKVVASLAEGTPQARLTREAKAVLQRLSKTEPRP